MTHNQHNIKYNNLIHTMNKYMMNNDNINNSINLKIKIEPNITFNNKAINNKAINHKVTNKTFNNDNLFWCVFIIKNGIEQFNFIHHKINIAYEKTQKIIYVEQIRKIKQLLKIYKLGTLQWIETQLVDENKIDICSFLALCVFENLNILYIRNKTCYELLSNDTNVIHVIKYIDNNKYEIVDTCSREQSCEYKSKYYQIENIKTPIKSISSYKLNELVQICNHLNINTINNINNKNKNKKDLYDEIIKHF
jgi:hypothetical protein